MDIGHYVLGAFVVLEGIAIAFLCTPWLQKKIVKRAIRLAKYTKAEAEEMGQEIKKVWG